jgi:hypothetical protein
MTLMAHSWFKWQSSHRLAHPTLRAASRSIALIYVVFVGVQPIRASAATGDFKIEYPALGSTIQVETSARFAGSVTSLIFRGMQYVDIHDHGRELQSSSSFDALGECFNPTEAGNIADHTGPTSSSKLLGSDAGPTWLKTTTEMAFWLPPGSDYKHECGTTPSITHAVNKTVRGGHILDKRIELGEGGVANVITDHVTFHVPEAHQSATFEAATIYTPSLFSQRYVLNFDSGRVEPTSRNGEQSWPVILATADGKNAVGLFSPSLPQPGIGIGYGTFNFPTTNKINCVFREKPIAAGEQFSYLCEFVVGTLDEVKTTILKLHQSRTGANQPVGR